MATFLFRLGRWSYLHRRIVLVVWLGILVAVAGASTAIQKGYNDLFSIDGVPSQHATEMLMEKFPGTKNPMEDASVTLVYQAPEGKTLTDPEVASAIDASLQAIRDNVTALTDEGRESLTDPVTANAAQTQLLIESETQMGLSQEVAEADAANVALVSADGTTGTTSFSFDVDIPADVTTADKDAVHDALDIAREAGLKAEAGGAGFGDPIEIEPISEVIGVIVAFIVLIFTFGSLLAAGLPLITAVIGIGIGALGISGATAFVALNNITPVLGIMIGLAVGIDYALFIMSRFRDELRQGRSRADAVGLATGTAGSAVVFAGLTVIVALVGLVLADIEFLTYMGFAAAAIVLIAVLVALTLLPALLGFGGQRVFRKDAAFGRGEIPDSTTHRGRHGKRRKLGPIARLSDRLAGTSRAARKARNPYAPSLGTRWVALIHRAPGVFVVVVIAVLVALTLPAQNLQLSLPSDSTSPESTTQRRSADLIEENFGAGRNSPLLVIVDGADADPDSVSLQPLVAAGVEPAQAAFVTVKDQLSNNVGVKRAQLISASEDGLTAQILVTPTTGPIDEQTVQLIGQLRDEMSRLENETGVDMGMTGFTPIQQDVTDRLEGAMPVYLALVVGLALILLLMVFRSLLVPVVAAAGFLLSIGAAFGVTVLFWQEGLWGLIESPGPLISFMPIFLIGVTFGLAMDYEVFILSRMRERWTKYSHAAVASGDAGRYNAVEDSVVRGFGMGARVVTAAALIMIAVFASFIAQPLPFIKVFGFALGAGVLFDAFFIRMTLVPALMFITGRGTWYMPKWLDRVLPTFDVEGEKLEKAYDSGEIERVDA
ncbi:MMPL family transporter [Corynebacterium terpenotabidum]|uniref:RND superfamily drug exporter n=1 Tax=Corynebacterium terpenotabidum Y-11 TaxID=1200352 RepID=S4XGY3_9CORY|nr:MMPL family transporter [Corynebacterium terpenotabidum]AGP31801.1 RND superfamily drug exporter [Corynebacterium terpenotabidum Y-11]